LAVPVALARCRIPGGVAAGANFRCILEMVAGMHHN
jgi:hypothetical protein